VEPVVISPGDSLDLHTFSPKEVVSLLGEFIELSQKADIRVVKIIHGKGTGILRRRVRSVLARDPRVVDFCDAPPAAGGWGATLVELRSGLADEDGKPGV
jgi:DNA-nicking Smr family endonuclease